MTFKQYLIKNRKSTAIEEMTAGGVGIGSSVAQGPGSTSDSYAAGDSRTPKLLSSKPFRRNLSKKRRRRK